MSVKNSGDIKIPRRILGTLLNSIGSGVVPRSGLEYIAIGRDSEISAIASDLDFINEGGAAFRFIIGRYGSGKSFMLQLIRSHCLDRGFVTADADLTPERKLSGAKGQGIATYRELTANLSTRAAPDGNAILQIISKWLTQLQTKLITEKGISIDSTEFDSAMTAEILSITSSLENLVFGFDFALVIEKYYQAHRSGDDSLKSLAVKWLRGEYSTKTEAKNDLKVGSIIDDANWYDFIKLLAVFVRRIGYRGLIIFIDECVNLYKIINRISRENNYEKILSMFNDALQGKAQGLGIFLGGTPQFLEDTRRGLYSYEALRSRLTEGRFVTEKYKNLMGPIIRLERLSDDEIFALALRVSALHAEYYAYEKALSDQDILTFLKLYLGRVGADKLITPREIIRDLLSVLDVMYQNPGVSFLEIVDKEQSGFSSGASDTESAEPVSDDGGQAKTAFDISLEDIVI